MKKGGLGKFLCGAAVGAGLGLLFAPKTGKETRADLKKKFDEVLEQVKSIKAEDVKESIVKKVNELQKELKDYNELSLEYIAFMPEKETLDNFIKNTNTDKLKDYISKLRTIELNNFEKGVITSIRGLIPLYKFEYALDLQNDLKSLSNFISGVLLTIAIGVTVITGAIMGLNFITQSIEEKAKVKESMVPWIIGIIVSFGAFTIWEVAVNLFQSL